MDIETKLELYEGLLKDFYISAIDKGIHEGAILLKVNIENMFPEFTKAIKEDNYEGV